jgi:hypothetical protein
MSSANKFAPVLVISLSIACTILSINLVLQGNSWWKGTGTARESTCAGSLHGKHKTRTPTYEREKSRFLHIGQIKGTSMKIRGSRPKKKKNSNIKSGDVSDANSIYSSEFVHKVR